MNRKFLFILFLFSLSISCSRQSKQDNETESTGEEEIKLGAEADLKEGQAAFFVNLNDGDEVTSPVKVQMGVEGMEIEPAGEPSVDKGHHHILIQREFIEKGTVVPTDSVHLHFGLGQQEAEIELHPGTYKLTLQFADGFHRSYGRQMSKSITITVMESEQ